MKDRRLEEGKRFWRQRARAESGTVRQANPCQRQLFFCFMFVAEPNPASGIQKKVPGHTKITILQPCLHSPRPRSTNEETSWTRRTAAKIGSSGPLDTRASSFPQRNFLRRHETSHSLRYIQSHEGFDDILSAGWPPISCFTPVTPSSFLPFSPTSIGIQGIQLSPFRTAISSQPPFQLRHLSFRLEGQSGFAKSRDRESKSHPTPYSIQYSPVRT